METHYVKYTCREKNMQEIHIRVSNSCLWVVQLWEIFAFFFILGAEITFIV